MSTSLNSDAETLRAAMERGGFSQVGMAKHLGVSASYVNQILNNKRPLSQRMRSRLEASEAPDSPGGSSSYTPETALMEIHRLVNLLEETLKTRSRSRSPDLHQQLERVLETRGTAIVGRIRGYFDGLLVADGSEDVGKESA